MWIISVEISAGSAVKLNDKYLQEFRNVSKYKEIQCCLTNLSEFIEILTHACVGILVHGSSVQWNSTTGPKC